MKITLKGKTNSIITINSMGIIIRGNSNDLKEFPGSIARNLEINENQFKELVGLEKAGLIEIEFENPEDQKSRCLEKEKNNDFCPKKIKNINNNEDDSNEYGDATIVIGGETKKTKFFNTPVEIEESENTQESLKVMAKLEEEENKLYEDKFQEENLDVSEKMGQKATISLGNKQSKQVEMKNSILSEKPNDVVFVDETNDSLDNSDNNFIEV